MDSSVPRLRSRGKRGGLISLGEGPDSTFSASPTAQFAFWGGVSSASQKEPARAVQLDGGLSVPRLRTRGKRGRLISLGAGARDSTYSTQESASAMGLRQARG